MVDLLRVGLANEIKETPLCHELGEQVVGAIAATDANQLDQMRMHQLLHDLHLLHEVLRQLIIIT